MEGDSFVFNHCDLGKSATKRGILSTVSSLFDPLGLVSPVILAAKVLMQRLWKQGLGWDDPVPPAEECAWRSWLQGLEEIATLRIPRWVTGRDDIVSTSLHFFADASTNGYGACAFARFQRRDGFFHCRLVLAKARTAPLKLISRLELQAAVLAVRLSVVAKKQLTMKLDRPSVFWTDSQTVLQFVNNDSRRFHTYVAHRVAEIREETDPAQRRHCPGN